jgi:hypothetical protein
MPEIVPCERRHPIAEADPKPRQRARQPTASALDLRVFGSVERRAAEVRDHLGAASMTRGVDDERGDQQGVALHQPKHRSSPMSAGKLIRLLRSPRILHHFIVLNNAPSSD